MWTRHAGSDAALFDDVACDLIYRTSNGVPRVINILCDTALVYGFADEQYTIGGALVRSVLKDKASTGLIRLFDTGELEEAQTEGARCPPEEALAVDLEAVPVAAADDPGLPSEELKTVKSTLRPLASRKKGGGGTAAA